MANLRVREVYGATESDQAGCDVAVHFKAPYEVEVADDAIERIKRDPRYPVLFSLYQDEAISSYEMEKITARIADELGIIRYDFPSRKYVACTHEA